MAPLTDAQLFAVQAASSAMSVLSFVGSSFIVACYLRFVALRKFSFLLVAILSLTDIGSQVFAVLVSPSAADLDAMNAGGAITPVCLSQAIGSSFCELSSVLWTTAIATTLYLFVWRRMAPEEIERLLPRFVLVCCGVPLVMALLPLADASYGPSGAWCWIRASRPAWIFAQFYAPLWLAIVFNAAVYVGTRRLLQQTVQASAASGEISAGDETALRLRRLIERLSIYPAILVVVWLAASVNRAYEAATGGSQPLFALVLVARCCSASQGALNALAYGFSDGVRGAVRAELSSLCPQLVPRAEDLVASVTARKGADGAGTAATAAVVATAAMAATAASATSPAAFASRSGAERERARLADEAAEEDVDGDLTVVVPQRSIAAIVTENPAAAGGGALEERRDRVALALAPPR
jgi:hypothetical protein